MSVTHSWFGSVRAKLRSTRSAAIWSGLAWRHFGRPVAPSQAGAAHQQGDGVVADHNPSAQPQLGMHA
jgi:hypothetical protein